MRGTRLSGEIDTRHARPDKRTLPAAFRPNEVLSLSLIAGMAHSTLKSRAATRDGVAFGYRLKIRVIGHGPRSQPCPPSNRKRTWPPMLPIRRGWIDGQFVTTVGGIAQMRQNQDLRTFR